MVQNHIRRAALARDEEALARCRDGLTDVMRYVDADPAKLPKSRDGWWRDGSFSSSTASSPTSAPTACC